MSILIATPCYAGLVTAQHMKSCLELRSEFVSAGIDHDWNLGWNESLIQRARNSMAAIFLETRFQKLLFIDADIQFHAEDVARLWNLNEQVSVGLYPMKHKDVPLGAWRDGKLVKLKDCPAEPFEVDFAGTGFFMIDRSTLMKMKEAYPEREHDEGKGRSFAWFYPRLADEGGWYMSEDYAFCHDWRKIGGKIIADPAIKLIHHGSYAYEAPE
jgi:glycosyltransferase involved in cell wall biosynthesis